MPATTLQHLPNELLLEIFRYIDSEDLYTSCLGLNARLNHLLHSLSHLSLQIKNNALKYVELFATRITCLKVYSSHDIDWNLFPNVCSLMVTQMTWSQSTQLAVATLSSLTHLSLVSRPGDDPSSFLAYQVFSNWFPALRYVDLGRVDMPYGRSWSQSPSLRCVSIVCSDSVLLQLVPKACPCLYQLKMRLVPNNCTVNLPSSPSQRQEKAHPLQCLILSDQHGYLSLGQIDFLLVYLSNIEKLHLVLYDMPFFQLARTLQSRLLRMRQFDCHVGSSSRSTSSTELDAIRRTHPCFHRIQFVQRRNGWQTYTTQLNCGHS